MNVNWDESFLKFAWAQLLDDFDFLMALGDLAAAEFLAANPDFGQPKS